MNWTRPIKKIKVKSFDYPIVVDKCLADLIVFIDSLPDTQTCWSCCHHGLHKRTQLEFRTKLKLKPIRHILTRASWQDKNNMKGYCLALPICKCDTKIIGRAKKHFNTTKPVKKVGE
jgi:hypothetical protein